MPFSRKVLLAHPGTQYAFQLAHELSRRNYLHQLHTCLAFSGNSGVVRWLTPRAKLFKIERQWQNRIVRGVQPRQINCYPFLEIETWWRLRNQTPANKQLRLRNNCFQAVIVESAIDACDIVIGFDTSSQILAERAKAHGKKFVLDRSIAHPRAYQKVAEELSDRFPAWQDASELKSETELALEDKEHDLADRIVVPSRFVARTLKEYGVAANKIRINRFGTDTNIFRPYGTRQPTNPLVFLFVGALTARKGLPLLLEAWKKISPKEAELWIIGQGRVPDKERRGGDQTIKWLGSVSRQQLASIFQKAHVFVFPSLFEGLAQVQVEAAACCLPIITTTAAGGEDIVEEGRTGFVIAPGRLDQLVERICLFLECPRLITEMSQYATSNVLALDWSSYGDRWQKLLDEEIN